MVALQIIGGGQMGQALLGGLLSAGWSEPANIVVVEVAEAQRDRLAQQFPGVVVQGEPVAGCDTMVAVKPHLVETVCQHLVSPTRLLSIAAGITIAALERSVPAGTPVVRAMPNTPALVGQGAAGLAGGTHTNDADLEWALGILRAVGAAEIVTEAQLDAVTGLSGSGPAYIFMVAEAMIDGGVTAGLPRPVAKTLAYQVLAGAATMLRDSDAPASELRANVTTPAGTTAAGLRELENAGLRAAFINAIGAATDRSRQLGA